jgi:hypothetical protein
MTRQVLVLAHGTSSHGAVTPSDTGPLKVAYPPSGLEPARTVVLEPRQFVLGMDDEATGRRWALTWWYATADLATAEAHARVALLAAAVTGWAWLDYGPPRWLGTEVELHRVDGGYR